MNHLLKLPFCIHPATGSVCVPINHERVKEFDIKNPLTLKNIASMTYSDSQKFDDKENAEKETKAIEYYINYFESYVKNLCT